MNTSEQMGTDVSSPDPAIAAAKGSRLARKTLNFSKRCDFLTKRKETMANHQHLTEIVALEANLDDLTANIRLFRELIRKSENYEGDFKNHELFRSCRKKFRLVVRQGRAILTRPQENPHVAPPSADGGVKRDKPKGEK